MSEATLRETKKREATELITKRNKYKKRKKKDANYYYLGSGPLATEVFG